MNIFRFIADMLHLAAILTLLYRIKVSRNVVGKYIFSITLLCNHPTGKMSHPYHNFVSLLIGS